jgi:biopolymer transport protein ExbD
MKHGYHGWRKTAVKWPNRISLGIDPYPFVGAAFTLLLAIMIGTPTPPYHGAGPDLAPSRYATSMPRALREDAQIVSIMQEGQVYYHNFRISTGELNHLIRDSVKSGADRKIYVRVDARAKYGRVNQVLDEIGKAGVENVSFLAARTFM